MGSFRSFLGKGILRPFRRDGKNDFANGVDLQNVRACVGQILGTQCESEDGRFAGEVPWMPEFGSLLYRLKHKKGRVLIELGRHYVVDALRRWEPRVTVSDALVSFDPLTETLTIRLLYNVIDKNVPGNQVIFPDVEQTVDLPLAA